MSNTKILEINNAKVALYPVKGVRSVIVYVMVEGGPWYETGNQWGAFHLLEHLLFEGNNKLKTHNEIESYRQSYGISNDAWTSGRNVGFWFKFPDISINQGFEFLDNFLFNPLIPEDKFSKEISVIEQEYKDRWDDPMTRFNRIINKNLFGKNHIFNRDAIGQPEYLKSITRSHLLKLHQDFFQPQNFSISVVGNFNLNTVIDNLSLMLGNQTNKFNIKSNWNLIQPEVKHVGYQDKVRQSYFVANWIISPDKKMDYKTEIGLNIFNFILSGSSNSILFKKIRQELGLVYSINSRSLSYPNAHTFEIWSSVDSNNINILTENIKNTLKEFLETPINENVFEQSRYYMDLQTLMSYDSIYNIGNSLVDDLFYNHKIYSPEDRIKIAKSINPEEIRILLKERMDWKNAYINVMSPES